MVGNGKRHRWKLSFHRTTAAEPPKEFLCPISGTLMHDPVVIPTGQTFDRISTQVCKDYNFTWTLDDGTKVDFSNTDLVLIPNLSIKSTIQNWVSTKSAVHLPTPDYSSVESIVSERIQFERINNPLLRVSERELIRAVPDKPRVFDFVSQAQSEIGPTHVGRFYQESSSGSFSGESVVVGGGASPPSTPLTFKRKPSCYSSCSTGSSSSEIDPGWLSNPEEGEIVRRMRSGEVFEQEEGAVLLRRITKVDEKSRVSLCSAKVVSELRELMSSRYAVVQTNAVAALVNLSLEKCNKLKLVRAGVVPVVIDVLKGGVVEAQEHAAGALFSLALEDENKMAIGVLGGLPPLMYALRSESERTRNDSALALYHLSLVKSNQVKLVKLGAVNTLLGMVRSGGFGGFLSRVLLVLCNLAVCDEGRSAMLDANAVECFVGMLRRGEFDSEATRENCVAALYALSHGSLRFKGLAKESRAVEVLKEIEETGTDRAREKARRILQMMKGRGEGEDGQDVDWERILESGGFSRTRNRIGGARNADGTNSNKF